MPSKTFTQYALSATYLDSGGTPLNADSYETLGDACGVVYDTLEEAGAAAFHARTALKQCDGYDGVTIDIVDVLCEDPDAWHDE